MTIKEKQKINKFKSLINFNVRKWLVLVFCMVAALQILIGQTLAGQFLFFQRMEYDGNLSWFTWLTLPQP